MRIVIDMQASKTFIALDGFGGGSSSRVDLVWIEK
jgi:hypothetical protein